MTEAKPLLRVDRITKRYPGVLANDQVSFSIEKGKIHALLGENGAGKSTIIKIIYGVSKQDSGQIFWQGSPLDITNPRQARARGIAMVFQHFSLFQALTVMENIALGMEKTPPGDELEARIRSIMETYQLDLDPHRVVSSLSVGEQQRIEIVRALLLNPSLLIMDEPTSVLTPQEVRQLFTALDKLTREGRSILYISHKLAEVQEICSSATVLRDGKVVANCDPREVSREALAEMMVGARLKPLERQEETNIKARPFLEVNNLSLAQTSSFSTALSSISFTVNAGSILGIAGVAGNGQNELLSVLSGEQKVSEDRAILFQQQPIGRLDPSERRRMGLCAIPEERNNHAAAVDFSLADNTLITARETNHLVSRGLISRSRTVAYAKAIIEAFSVKAIGSEASASSLSGGNLQKYIMGRDILQSPACLIVSQPTWGVDPGAAMTIRQRLVTLAESGAAIIILSQDLDELLSLCDYLAVMNEGRLSSPQRTAQMSIEDIGLLMGGAGESSKDEVSHADV